MAIAFRSAANAGTSTAGTSLTITKPAGAVAGDFLVAAIQCGSESSRGVQTPPAGWNSIVGYNSEVSVLINTQVWGRVADGTEGANFTWTNTGGGAWAGSIVCYSGVSNGTPTSATMSEQETTNDTAVTHSGLTTVENNSVALYIYGVNEGATPTRIPLTEHASTTKRGEANSTTNSVGHGVMIAEEARPTAGATGARSVTTAGGNTRNTALAVELLLDTGGGGSGALLMLAAQ